MIGILLIRKLSHDTFVGCRVQLSERPVDSAGSNLCVSEIDEGGCRVGSDPDDEPEVQS